MTAFDTLEAGSSSHFGENTFRVVYAILHRLNLSDIPPIYVILDWIQEPIKTNTYTGLYPFFKDFGLWGVGIFAVFFGIFFGWIFKRAQQGNNMFMLIYALYIPIIVMQYVAELFFTNFTLFFKQIILVIIPFLFSKYKLLHKKTE